MPLCRLTIYGPRTTITVFINHTFHSAFFIHWLRFLVSHLRDLSDAANWVLFPLIRQSVPLSSPVIIPLLCHSFDWRDLASGPQLPRICLLWIRTITTILASSRYVQSTLLYPSTVTLSFTLVVPSFSSTTTMYYPHVGRHLN